MHTGNTSTQHSGSVLLVDDNRDAADSLQSLFAAHGFDASCAYGGAAALDIVRRCLPDVIVMDLGMPGINGYEAARQIRSLPGGSAVIMIALTGWGHQMARDNTLEVGFDFHVVKPVNFDFLLKYLREQKVFGLVT